MNNNKQTEQKPSKECGHFNLMPFGCEDCFAGPEEVKADLEKRKQQEESR